MGLLLNIWCSSVGKYNEDSVTGICSSFTHKLTHKVSLFDLFIIAMTT